jgi:hypothetical protein
MWQASTYVAEKNIPFGLTTLESTDGCTLLPKIDDATLNSVSSRDYTATVSYGQWGTTKINEISAPLCYLQDFDAPSLVGISCFGETA